MTSYSSNYQPTMARPATYNAPMPVGAPAAPAGTFAPGTKIQVGGHKVVIQKYFSEGGFAHVYLVKLPKPIDGTDIAVLKRVAVPDKDALANMRTEVETMKKLKGHRPIVTYYDSHASQMQGGGYEVFLLMEFCNGGGLIDFMNTRLQNRLKEPEILKIFSDVTEGVACMHYLKPPLLHRDLKVENVLISTNGSSRRFKLCDFGSTAPPRPAGSTPAECRLIEDDVQKHTTLQYRSPEMIDVYRKQPIDEKSDIWALGVLLYKLCYYTTPFEEQGQLAILNASFKFPAYPPFSDKLKMLIASMLKENPRSRPNIYQVLREACLMQNIPVPIKDIYTGRTESEARRTQKLPNPDPEVASPPLVGAVYAPPVQTKQEIPDIAPMRRGRPTASQPLTKPAVSPARVTNKDPFAALDSNNHASSADELADRFPSLDQFSLLHDGAKYDFGSGPAKPKDLKQRVTERLADDAFATVSKKPAPSQLKPSKPDTVKAPRIITEGPSLPSAVSAQSARLQEPQPSRPTMVSTGTMTSPLSSTPPREIKARQFTPSPIYRFPPADHHRSASLPRGHSAAMNHSQNTDGKQSAVDARQSSFLQPNLASHSVSLRPSMDGDRPDLKLDDPVPRTRSSNAKSRPSSTYLESSMDYLREQEASKRPGFLSRKSSNHVPPRPSPKLEPSENAIDDEEIIESNVDFLRNIEEQNEARKKDSRHMHHPHLHHSHGDRQNKRSSLPSMSLSGTKTLLAGRFGDAFKRFEGNASNEDQRASSPDQDLEERNLTPIAGSEATDGRSDDGNVLEASDDMAPEQRRELERRRLSMEEKRVANAAAEYRRRLADREPGARKPSGAINRASTIQNKVQSLLDDSQRQSATKTAEGYGRFTASSTAPPQASSPFPKPTPGRKPVTLLPDSGGTDARATKPYGLSRQAMQDNSNGPINSSVMSGALPARSVIVSARAPSMTGAARPNAPPKPVHLNNVATGPQSSTMNVNSRPKSPSKPAALRPASSRRIEAHPDMSAQEKEDYIADFSRRYPSLSGIEMVETEVGESNTAFLDREVRTKEV